MRLQFRIRGRRFFVGVAQLLVVRWLDIMKTFNTSLVILGFVFASLVPRTFAQQIFAEGLDGLQIGGEAFYNATDTKLGVEVRLLNSTNHDITVLTKDSTWSGGLSTCWLDDTQYVCMLSFDNQVSSGGHPVAPSLADLEPVTVKPGEVAICHLRFANSPISKLDRLGKNSPVVIRYEVPPSLGARFGCWSGKIQSKPITVTIVAVKAKKEP